MHNKSVNMQDIEYSHQNKYVLLNGVDRPPRLLRFVAFVHLPFSFRLLDRFCCFTLVYEGHFILCYKEDFPVELSR